MFYNCMNLTKAPELPATTLASNCYNHMFESCTSLTKAPDLLATEAANGCYYSMFLNCSSLNSVRCYLDPNNTKTYTQSWLSNVATSGTIYIKKETKWPTGPSGIPSGWNVVNE